MPTPANHHGQISQIDSMQIWTSTFTVVYAVSKSSMNELEGTSFLRKSSGEGVKVTRYTADMLKDDEHLAKKVFKLAEKGQLGFEISAAEMADVGYTGIQFRNDVAARMASNQTFRVYTHEKQPMHEILHANVIGLDEEAYSSRAGLNIMSKTKSDEKLEKEHSTNEKNSVAIDRRPHHGVHSAQTNNSQKTTRQQRLSLNKLGESTIATLRKVESNRHKRAEERHEDHKKIDRKELKREEIKGEIKHKEIARTDLKKSHERANMNYGDGKEIDASREKKRR